MKITPQDVLNFWFKDLSPEQWFTVDPTLDQKIYKLFIYTLTQLSTNRPKEWSRSAQNRLAEIIVLDQFSRNIFRGTPKAFAQDELALSRAQEAVKLGLDKDLSTLEKSFMYMPYMHSESAEVHVDAVKLFSLPGLENNLEFELKHKKIIDRFGRYPHRNKILGRQSSDEEIEFLKTPNSSF